MIFSTGGIPANYKGKFENFFDWLRDLGLNGLEIQCDYGFRIAEKNQEIIRKEREKGIGFSIHAPFFVNLGSKNPSVVEKSKNDMKYGISLAQSIGVNRIIFHPGGGHENTEEGRKIAIKQLIEAVEEFTHEIDMKDVKLYPEIGGKSASLGSLDEIIEICKNCEYCYPCIDIAHLHAREVGSIVSIDVMREKLQKVKDALPEKFQNIHFHAYTINYGEKGELKHLKHGENMPDGSVGMPDLDDFIQVVKEMGIDPWIVSEASDTQEIGAKYMHDIYVNN